MAIDDLDRSGTLKGTARFFLDARQAARRPTSAEVNR
jgi:hypothetical protein